jgi:hypothetical protein
MELFLNPKKLKIESGEIYIRNINDSEFCYEIVGGVDFVLSKNKSFIIEGDIIIKTDENGLIYSKESVNKTYTKDEVISILKNVISDFEVKLNNLTNIDVPNSQNNLDKKNHETVLNEKKNENVLNENKIKKNKLDILVSAICFINRNKQGAEIYATFANRLLNDVMIKTPFDFRIITNEPNLFNENKNIWGDRVIVTEDKLINERLTVGPFNQLLKYKTMLGVDKKYDWLLYLDCDAGFTSELDIDRLEKQITNWESQGYDFLAARTNAVLRNELMDHENKKNNFLQSNPDKEFNPWIHGGNLFSAKFIFYKITSGSGPVEWGDPSKWMDSKLPSEHVWLIKNNEKLEKCGRVFKSLNEKFETQSSDNLITWDMEAFEVGVSAKLSGYNMGDLGNDGEFHILKIGFNFNNWEKLKY